MEKAYDQLLNKAVKVRSVSEWIDREFKQRKIQEYKEYGQGSVDQWLRKKTDKKKSQPDKEINAVLNFRQLKKQVEVKNFMYARDSKTFQNAIDKIAH